MQVRGCGRLWQACAEQCQRGRQAQWTAGRSLTLTLDLNLNINVNININLNLNMNFYSTF